MAILDKIRRKTTILILIIGLALFAFVVSGIFSTNAFSGAKVGSSVADVNGEEVSIDGFREQVEVASKSYGASASSMQIVNNVYEQNVRNAVLDQQFEKLGIVVEQDQIVNFLRTNPTYSQLPQFLNENGVFDESKFINFIADLKKNNPAGYQQWLQEEKNIIRAAKEQIYFNLIRAGVGTTLKEGELDYKLANDKLDISYVRVPYTSILDSTVAVSKSEIEAYVKAHKEDFKQDNSRDIQFVYFEEKVSLKDENEVKEKINALLNDNQVFSKEKDTTETVRGFRNTTDNIAFLDINSDTKFDTIYKPKSSLPANVADTLVKLSIGTIYGPYRDGNTFKVSKLTGKRAGGNVKASHILIAFSGASNAGEEVTRTKEEAESKAKEVLAEAKKSGAVFADLAKENSDGPSGPRGGDLGFFQKGAMVKPFNDFVFNNGAGSIGLVETDFGFHIVKVEEKQDLYQVANLVREIEPSEETIDLLFQDATKFEMSTVENKSKFEEIAKKDNYVVRPVNKLNPMDENLPGLGAQRPIVQWAFNADSEIGDVKRFDLNDGYAVVRLTAKYAKGLMTSEDASAVVLPVLRKQKKAAMIMDKNKGKSFDAFAKDNNVSAATASAISVKSPTIAGAGREPAVAGTAYVLAEGKTSGLIEGESGVYMVTVTKKTAATKLDNYSTFANTLKASNATRVNSSVYQALKAASEIEDNRSMFY
ncbi:SurA N-terminal domain-containing protein [Cellulophaga sp. E16_2]|uniref:Periplasmic chaperone PpiD n=1 Tax=Cellulophaga algicola (strain DSM 14237 / IC166 / ACAM 630) TaxID=688270 RepID=E6X4E8_CELAD|nr:MULTISPECIES: peptidylprolyl isomerase [Cellulophaga]ADV48248.1 PpiC-type peptidyl-prolyl cis-trans isomerase [Cellulophaga algicola DSM 14237]MBO0590672.1 SurA N-terminal domain-containing protein [Cellulophaga sp. E16_2]